MYKDIYSLVSEDIKVVNLVKSRGVTNKDLDSIKKYRNHTSSHAIAVGNLASNIAKRCGMSYTFCEYCKYLGYTHDIGKEIINTIDPLHTLDGYEYYKHVCRPIADISAMHSCGVYTHKSIKHIRKDLVATDNYTIAVNVFISIADGLIDQNGNKLTLLSRLADAERRHKQNYAVVQNIYRHVEYVLLACKKLGLDINRL